MLEIFERIVADYESLRQLTEEQKEAISIMRRMIINQAAWDEKQKDEYAFGREPF